MDRKKILVLLLALVVLVGGIFFVTRSISNKNQAVTAPIANPVATKKEPANLFGQGTVDATKTTLDASGNVETILEKTLTIKNPNGSTVVNINGATPVMITDGKNSSVAGQMADLKVGDAVKVTYDTATKNTTLISVTKVPAPVKTK
ncbi:MAG: hypothetical protein NTY33_00940 [Candidatus Moranbacteria bacterium]|nr:hypothetical protein [Candidatus Moranbacteria bacterium]